MSVTAFQHESQGPGPSDTMKAIVAERYGLDALELREVGRPSIESGQVLVRVHASSVNPVDWYRVSGPVIVRFPNAWRRPEHPEVGGDLAGRVEAVGSDVHDLQPGDEVFGTTLGAWAEVAAARGLRLARKPANLSFAEAAAVPIAGITALQALRDHGGLEAGQRVLINGASGGVGTFAVQIAKALGGEVTAVTSTRNLDLARSLGADHVVDYTQEDFTRRDERHDLMLDMAGSRPFRRCRRVLTRAATVVVVGAKLSSKGLGPLPHMIGMRVASIGRSQTVRLFMAKVTTDDLGVLRELFEAGAVKPVIDRRYPLGETADALRYLGEGHARGKVVIDV